MNDVVIIDAGGANLGSVRAAFARLGVETEVSRDPARIATASKLVLPGVGAAAPVMGNLRDSGIDALLRGIDTPLLGICIGMQVLFEHSEEGGVAGLGLLRGEVRKLPATEGVRLPHMGWNRLEKRAASPLLDGIDGAARAQQPEALIRHDAFRPSRAASVRRAHRSNPARVRAAAPAGGTPDRPLRHATRRHPR